MASFKIHYNWCLWSSLTVPLASIEISGSPDDSIAVEETVGQFEVCAVLNEPVSDTATILIRSQSTPTQATGECVIMK